jgi:hypothetical protein
MKNIFNCIFLKQKINIAVITINVDALFFICKNNYL